MRLFIQIYTKIYFFRKLNRKYLTFSVKHCIILPVAHLCVAFEYRQSSETQFSEQSQGGSFNESIDERHNQSQAEQDWR